MSLHHTVGTARGLEVPNTVSVDDLTAATAGLPVGYYLVGDRDMTLLVTAYVPVGPNTVARLTPERLDPTDGFDRSLHTAAVRLGLDDHEPPAWLVIHDYS